MNHTNRRDRRNRREDLRNSRRARRALRFNVALFSDASGGPASQTRRGRPRGKPRAERARGGRRDVHGVAESVSSIRSDASRYTPSDRWISPATYAAYRCPSGDEAPCRVGPVQTADERFPHEDQDTGGAQPPASSVTEEYTKKATPETTETHGRTRGPAIRNSTAVGIRNRKYGTVVKITQRI